MKPPFWKKRTLSAENNPVNNARAHSMDTRVRNHKIQYRSDSLRCTDGIRPRGTDENAAHVAVICQTIASHRA
jgi:hypothetical protein